MVWSELSWRKYQRSKDGCALCTPDLWRWLDVEVTSAPGLVHPDCESAIAGDVDDRGSSCCSKVTSELALIAQSEVLGAMRRSLWHSRCRSHRVLGLAELAASLLKVTKVGIDVASFDWLVMTLD